MNRLLQSYGESALQLAEHAEKWEWKEVELVAGERSRWCVGMNLRLGLWPGEPARGLECDGIPWRGHIASAGSLRSHRPLWRVYALLLGWHQEDIARGQLQATYLANVYSKQVDGLAAFNAS